MVGLALRFRLSQDKCLHKWDERFHALVAKNLINHPLEPTLYENPLLNYDYKEWYSNHIWVHKQPLPLWLIATSYRIFGVTELATRIPSFLFSVLAIFITYLLGQAFFTKKTGILSAFFISINGVIIEIGAGRIATDHYDILFLAFIEISILFAYYNSKNKSTSLAILSGIFIGFAIITKWLPALIVLPIHLTMLLQFKASKNEIIKFLLFSFIASIVIAAPWQIYILRNFTLEAKWEYYHHWLHLSSQLDGQPDDGWLHYLNNIRIKYSEIIYIPLVYLVYKLAKSKFRDYTLLTLFIWISIPLIFFSFAKTKMTGYILFISPALFIVTAFFFFDLKDKLINEFSSKGLKVLSWILLVLMIALPVRYCFERTSFGFEKPKHEEYCDDYKKFQNRFQKKSVVLNIEYPIEFMFYTNATAYSINKLEKSDFEAIKNKGYKIYYYNKLEKTISEVN